MNKTLNIDNLEICANTLPFLADKRKLYKIGVVFDSKKRILKYWKVAE